MAAAETLPVPTSNLEELPEIVARLRSAFESGRTRPLEWRRSQLRALRALLTERAEVFVEALAADLGKPALEAHAADVAQGKIEAGTALRRLRRWTRPERVGRVPFIGRGRVLREPLGVVLIIAPWNYPVGLLLAPAVGAIAAGNAVVLKPSEVTPHTSAALAEWLPRYLDPEAIALVEGGVTETTALLEQRFDHIFYTGNGRVARVVLQAAAHHLTPVTLELGGKSPCLVAKDADLRTTARRIAWGKFLNAGQTCIAPDYVLVERSREQALVAELRSVVERFYGPDPAASPDYARIVNERHHRRLAALLAEGEVAFGGQLDPKSGYIAPTVVQNVSLDSPLMREEIFGPILPVIPVDSMDEAIDFVNAREKPLALYLFTRDRSLEERVLAQTSSGGACVNGTIVHITDPRLPFGGVGASGTGAYHGRHSFETFSHRRAVVTRGVRIDPSLLYPPYGKRTTALLRRFI
ncbi:MAG: aldehyde dehydrogenase family protein [Myxococcota bacterium]